MTREERMKEIMKASPDFGKGVGYKMCVVDELHDMKESEKMAITAGTRCCGKCGKWYYGYSCPYCNKNK